MSTPKQILDDVRVALELAIASKGASATVRVRSRDALAKLDSLEVTEGEIEHYEPPDDGLWVAFWTGTVGHEPLHTVKNTSPALLLTEGAT